MERRGFLRATTVGFALAAASPAALGAEAAPGRAAARIPRIGVLGESNPLAWTFRSEAFDLECRWAHDSGRRLGDLALELLTVDVDLIVAVGRRAALAAAGATRSVPVVFVVADAPAAVRLSGANLTGLCLLSEAELAARRLGLLRMAVPRLARVGVLWNADNATHDAALHDTRRVAESHGIEVCTAAASMANRLDAAVGALGAASVQACVVLPDALFSLHNERLVEMATARGLPGVYPAGSFARAGGLMALQGDSAAVIEDVSSMVRRILAGVSPAALPIRRQGSLTLTVNRASAGVLGVALPPALLRRASAVIG